MPNLYKNLQPSFQKKNSVSKKDIIFKHKDSKYLIMPNFYKNWQNFYKNHQKPGM